MLQKKTFFLFLPAALLLILSLFYYQRNRQFAVFTDTLFKNEVTGNTINLHYTLAHPENFGIRDYEVTLGHADPSHLQASAKVLFTYQTVLDSLPENQLNRTNRRTRQILAWYLSNSIKGTDFLLYEEPLGPTLGVQAQLPVLLSEYAFYTKTDINDYMTLLTKIPAYFEEILVFEKAKADAGLFMSENLANSVISQCQSFASLRDSNILLTSFEEKINNLSFLPSSRKTALISRNRFLIFRLVLPAYQNLASELHTLKTHTENNQGLCYLADGRNYYTWLVNAVTGCDSSISAIRARLISQVKADLLELQSILVSHPELLRDSSRLLTMETISLPSEPKSILEDLKKKMTSDFPPLSDVAYSVKYVNASMEPYTSPAFYLTPPLDNLQNNLIYINSGSDCKGLDLYAMLAHEGWPGHLYQTVYASKNCTPLRNILNFGGYTEGWATYIELMSFSYADVPDEIASLYRLNRSLTLGLSCILDIDIHYYGYTRAQTSAFLADFGMADSSDAFYDIILEAPANYLKYYVGCLCFQDLQAAVRQKDGDRFSLKEFHRRILETGPCPFSVLYDIFNISGKSLVNSSMHVPESALPQGLNLPALP